MAASVPSFAFLALGTEYPGARSEKSCFCCAHHLRESEHYQAAQRNSCVERSGLLNADFEYYSDAPTKLFATVDFQ